MESIIFVVTVSLGTFYESSICSICPLRMETNALEKSTNKSIATRFFVPTPSMIRQDL